MAFQVLEDISSAICSTKLSDVDLILDPHPYLTPQNPPSSTSILRILFLHRPGQATQGDNLINSLATAMLKKVGLTRGRPGSEQELAIITSQLRRRISAATARANFTLLLERMAQVGEEARRAENRRWLVSMEEG